MLILLQNLSRVLDTAFYSDKNYKNEDFVIIYGQRLEIETFKTDKNLLTERTFVISFREVVITCSICIFAQIISSLLLTTHFLALFLGTPKLASYLKSYLTIRCLFYIGA